MDEFQVKVKDDTAVSERRGSPRLKLQIPLFIRGTDASGAEFLDLAKTLDISATGALLASPRPLHKNHHILLTIPAPPSVASASTPAYTPPIQARVRRQQTIGKTHFVGVEFLRPLE